MNLSDYKNRLKASSHLHLHLHHLKWHKPIHTTLAKALQQHVTPGRVHKTRLGPAWKYRKKMLCTSKRIFTLYTNFSS